MGNAACNDLDKLPAINDNLIHFSLGGWHRGRVHSNLRREGVSGVSGGRQGAQRSLAGHYGPLGVCFINEKRHVLGL